MFTQHLTRAGYILKVQVFSYASTSHLKSSGFCCRTPASTDSTCTQDCNNRFSFCLRPPGIAPDNSTCPTPDWTYTTGTVSDDMMEFESGRDLDANVPNPLVFTGESWPVSVTKQWTHTINDSITLLCSL